MIIFFDKKWKRYLQKSIAHITLNNKMLETLKGMSRKKIWMLKISVIFNTTCNFQVIVLRHKNE